jgi:2-polyprenyl-3-methyl-5-hydroxy-6-metoxy-1,4-benzoquinol methylase
MVPEQMDDPGLCPKEHARALAGLRRINRLSGTSSQMVREILDIAARHPKREWRILDLGCANGELALELARDLDSKLSYRITGWDISSNAILQARENLADQSSLKGHSTAEPLVQFEVRDVFAMDEKQEVTGGSQSVPAPPFDIVYCTLFLHHFDDESSVRLMRRMKRLASVAVIVDDLQRTHAGWWLAYLGCHLLSRSPVVHFDGPQSVRAALTVEEARAFATKAQLEPVAIRKHWPERYLLRWERPQS